MLRIHILFSLFFTAVMLTVSAQQTPSASAPAVPKTPEASTPGQPAKKTAEEFHYFQQSGISLDALICRIQFKISYSWMKSREYFTLAMSSPADALPAKGRDLESRVNLKTEAIGQKASELQQQAIEAGKSKIAETAANLAGHTEKLKTQVIQAGNEWKAEAETELRQKLGK